MRATSCAVSLALLVLLAPRLAAQAAPPPRLAWPLIDFVLLGDSIHGVQVLAAPNLTSAIGQKQFQAAALTFQPRAARIWSAGIASVVESIAKLPDPKRGPFVTLAITAYRRHAWMRVSRTAEADSVTPFNLELYDSSAADAPEQPISWLVPATAADLLSLLTTLDGVAEESALDSTAALADSTRTFLAEELDQLPQQSGPVQVEYPAAARQKGQSGRAWLEFVVDTGGAVQVASARLLLSDGEDFAQAAVAALPALRYSPALRRGRRVKALVRAPFVFQASGAQRIRHVPFTIVVPGGAPTAPARP